MTGQLFKTGKDCFLIIRFLKRYLIQNIIKNMLSLHLGYKVQDRNELYPENLGISTILLTIINLLLNLSLKSKIMFIFSDYKTFPANNDIRSIIIDRGICSKESLLALYGHALGYSYQLNWDSFNDIIVEWVYYIPEKEVWIKHMQLPDLDSQNLSVYLEILDRACKIFKRYPDGYHNLKVYFNISDKQIVNNILSKKNGFKFKY